MKRQPNQIRTRRDLLVPFNSLIMSVLVFSIGCSVMPKPKDIASKLELNSNQSPVHATISQRAEVATHTAKVSNPLAKEIRFDGQELVLGSGKCQAIPSNELRRMVHNLLNEEKKRSATALVNLHTRSAQQMLITGVTEPKNKTSEFVAQALDSGKPKSVWVDHLEACKSKPNVAKQFATARVQLLSKTDGDQAIEKTFSELKKSASELNSLPVQLETQRVVALASIALDDPATAVNELVSAAETAAKAGLASFSADLWMMACKASLRMENVNQARQCWKAAVANQLTSIRSRPADQKLPAVDTVFWEQADHLRHPGDRFPTELNLAFAPWYSRIGIETSTETSPDVVLWSTIAEFQLATGQPHLAALSIKRAETGSTSASKPWLQIALARSMAAQGQESVAVTILGSLSEDANPSVQAAALATMGSFKVQAGAYEQGSRFLVKALNMQTSDKWPGQLAAKADLANVRLIVGRFDEALPALHAVQNEMMTAGRWQSLCQSLENEAAIVELEQGKRQAREIRDRIRQLEQL